MTYTHFNMKKLFWSIMAASISFLRPSHAIRTQCVVTPIFPLNGRLEVSGTFTLKLTCRDPEGDLPLTAPGHHGVMMCKEDAEEMPLNNDFFNLRIPDCHKKRLATRVALPVTLRIAANKWLVKFDVRSDNKISGNSCNTLDLVHGARLKLRILIKKHVCRLCDYELDYCRVAVDRSNITNGSIPIDIFINVIAPYADGDIGNSLLQEYTQQTQDILTNLAYPAIVGSSTITSDWIADCDRYTSAGVPVKLLAAPLCRGCPTSMYKAHPRLDHCANCPHGATAPPYSAACVTCPADLGDDMDLRTQCFSRE